MNNYLIKIQTKKKVKRKMQPYLFYEEMKVESHNFLSSSEYNENNFLNKRHCYRL